MPGRSHNSLILFAAAIAVALSALFFGFLLGLFGGTLAKETFVPETLVCFVFETPVFVPLAGFGVFFDILSSPVTTRTRPP